MALYQLSYYRKWCPGTESNHRHVDFQSTALPTELPGRMAMRKGLEPSTSSVTGWHSNQLNYRTIFGGNNRARTCDPLLVRQMLSQLSYAPNCSYEVALSRRHEIYYNKSRLLSIPNRTFLKFNFLVRIIRSFFFPFPHSKCATLFPIRP